MLRISSKGRYGTRLMLQLALRYGDGPVLLRKIGTIEDLSVRYLEQIVPALKKAQLVNSTRGAHGGYRLARKPDEITLGEIIEALEGPVVPANCINILEICERSAHCVTRQIWKELGEKMSQTLNSYTLQDIVDMHRNNHQNPLSEG